MSDGMGRELAYLSSHATNRYFISNWGTQMPNKQASTHIPTKKNNYFLARLQIFRNKVAVFSFIFIS